MLPPEPAAAANTPVTGLPTSDLESITVGTATGRFSSTLSTPEQKANHRLQGHWTHTIEEVRNKKKEKPHDLSSSCEQE